MLSIDDIESLSALNVATEVDLVRQLRDVDLEPLLHLVQCLGISLVRHEGDRQALSTEPEHNMH